MAVAPAPSIDRVNSRRRQRIAALLPWLALVTGIILLLAVGLLAARSVNQLVAAANEEAEAQRTLTMIEELVAGLENANGSINRYLLDRSNSSRRAYAQARDRANASFERLYERLRSEPAEQKLLTRLNRLVRVRLIELDKLAQFIAASEKLPLDLKDWPLDTVGGVSEDGAEALDQSITALTGQLRSITLARFQAKRDEVTKSAAGTITLFTWGGVIAALLVAGAAWLAYQQRKRQRAAEAQLVASEAWVRQLIDAIPAMIVYVDPSLTVRYHNRAFRQFWGKRAVEVDGARIDALVGTEAYAPLAAPVQKALAGAPGKAEPAFADATGQRRNFALTLTPRLAAPEDAGIAPGVYGMLVDITERTELERLKGEFVATISHELRTPLTSILGALALARDGAGGALPTQALGLLDIAERNATRLSGLVNDILDLEKIEGGHLSLKPHAVAILPLLQAAAEANAPYAASLGVQVEVRVGGEGEGARDDAQLPAQPNASPEPLSALCDPERVTQVLANLISNACKYSPAGSRVTLTAARQGDAVQVSVADTGEGIPLAFQPFVFEKFSQAEATGPARLKGTGLGLAICKSLVEQMGGRIGFRSEPGVGSTFFFTLPTG
jgi:PAS domain S-box-containing protein